MFVLNLNSGYSKILSILIQTITQIRQDSVLISEQRNTELSPNNFNEYLLKKVNEVYFKSYAMGFTEP